MRVMCAVRGGEDKDRELTFGFYKIMVLSDPHTPTATCNHSSNTTHNNKPT